MVYIRRIDIRGFKTFAKKVSISLDRGFTVVTGPNGSGKSNILDGLKFALGELSPKELRGRSLSDLVHKSQAEGPRSAYVAVQFDNSDKKIPVESDLITVSREFSRGGEGIYRLNGRRLSRKQVQDILSSADIQVSGFNLIAQHAITRLAEIGTEERRRILEDLIGIGVFETKKAEAKDQLQTADINLKVASAKVDEVRNRIEELERERNDLLRHKLLVKEVNEQQARILSSQIAGLGFNHSAIVDLLGQEQAKLDEIRKERDSLNLQRAQVEEERRRFEEKSVTLANEELFEIERKIAEESSELVRAKTEADTLKTIVATRTRQRDSLLGEIAGLESNVKALTSDIRSMTSRRTPIEEKYSETVELAEKLAAKLNKSRENLALDNKKLEDLQEEIDSLSKELSRLTVSSKGSSTKLDLTAVHLQTLEARHSEFAQLSEDLKKRIREMDRLGRDEEKRLRSIEDKLGQYSGLKSQRKEEIEEAIEIAKKARVTVVEFNTQKNLAENLQAEERAIQKIEEMAEEGALDGIIGLFEESVKFNSEYEKAVVAASAGWMRALIVKDLEVAIKCVASLKRTKLGRVKIIPLDDLEINDNDSDYPEAPGIIGPLSDVVRSDKTIAPAVRFVFGDTMLASNQKAAFLSAARGQRCVVTTGDLYEPGGGLESGYYRAPFDIGTLVPRSTALEGLEKTVRSLESIVQRQRSDVDRLEAEIDKLREDRVSTSKIREGLARELEFAQKSLARTREALQATKRRIDSLRSSMEKEKLLLDESASKQAEMKRRLSALEEERERLRIGPKRAAVSAFEKQREEAAAQAESLLREKLELENKLASEQSTLDTLRPGFEQVRIQVRSLEAEIRREESRMKDSLERVESLQARRKELELVKGSIVESLGSVSAERRKYESRFAEIEENLQVLLSRMDPASSKVSDLKGEMREVEARLAMLESQLKSLGDQTVLQVGPQARADAEELKRVLQEELDGIGAVNQLAVQQYEQQKDGYKQLSVRITELEQEKLAVLDFMNELERRKRDSFMEAYSKVNQTFQELFSEMTSEEGNGRMVLDNPDDPFSGGLDVLLQFPGKPELTMSSASGGEKSVATVCYLLALQQIHPMPFYVMDEIDAHLDVVNTKRLATLVRSRSKGSQFIVISLKDSTISRAERVYGVYSEAGESRVVSLPSRGEPN